MTESTHKPDGESTASDLNEVLRLQAVALARMSERMNTPQSGSVKSLPPIQERHGSHLPVLASDMALSEDSMPVLNAFREYLDQERRRARARILWLSLLFASLFAGTVAVLLWMDRERVQEMRADLGTANKMMEASRENANAEIKKLSETANRSVEALKQDLSSSMSMAQLEMGSNLNARLQNRDAELELLKEKLSALEIENAVLLGRLREEADRQNERPAVNVEMERDEVVEAPPVIEDVVGGLVESNTVVLPPIDKEPIVIQKPSYNRQVRMKMPVMTP